MPNKFVSIEPDEVTYNQWNQPVYFTCEGRFTIHFPWGGEIQRCGGASMYLLTQIGELSHQQFTMHLCETHARPYLKEQERLQNETSKTS
jgi:hypothetical protein